MTLPNGMKPALWGAVGGAIATAIAGFTIGGWMTASKAEAMAHSRATTAVVSALAPICATNFKSGEGQQALLVDLKAKSTWEQAAFVEKGGWTKMPGMESVSSGLARTCVELILAEK